MSRHNPRLTTPDENAWLLGGAQRNLSSAVAVTSISANVFRGVATAK
jgi:hypothetical protein